jgi:hypothetical protein
MYKHRRSRKRFGPNWGRSNRYAGLDDKALQMGNRLSEGNLRPPAIVRARTDPPDWDAVKADFQDAIAIFEKI